MRKLFDSGKLVTHVGTVLPLEDARIAHEMLAGRPHRRGRSCSISIPDSRDC